MTAEPDGTPPESPHSAQPGQPGQVGPEADAAAVDAIAANGPDAGVAPADQHGNAAGDGAGRASTVDPWAHRRGEPRLFSVLWTVYVLVAMGGSVVWLSTTGRFTATGYGPAARIMLMVVMAGVVLVWPMTRLSQVLPDEEDMPAGKPMRETRPAAAMLADVPVIQVPVQLVIWPLLGLAGWPLAVVGAVSMLFLVWTVVVGGLVAIALEREWAARRTRPRAASGNGRAGWMAAIVGVVVGGPVVQWLVSAGAGVSGGSGSGAAGGVGGGGGWGWWAMVSPFSALRATTGWGVGGVQYQLTTGQIAGVLGVGAVGMVLWVVAVWGGGRARG